MSLFNAKLPSLADEHEEMESAVLDAKVVETPIKKVTKKIIKKLAK